MTNPNEVKPCPFCGGEAEMHGSDNGPLLTGWFIRCTDCDTSTKCSENADGGASVITAWNTRTSATSDAAEIQKLRALLLRYRNEVPLGHQPHMIAHEVDAALTPSKQEGA